MTKILLLGGYGGFGARIARRLARAGFEVLVAGRNHRKATDFCSGNPALKPLVLDRATGISTALEVHRPWAVVDAAGPFQGADYAVARAAIQAGCHYLDIADARDFVCKIACLDEEARAAGVAVISGASSLPALSGALVSELAAGLSHVAEVEIILSASSRGTAGASVASAILSYLGKPIRLWRGGRWTTGYGWQELKTRSFAIPGSTPLRGRLVALADVPDLELLPRRLPGAPAVTFRAGTDVSLHNLTLWLLSWPVRWGWIAGLDRLGALASRLQRLTVWASSSRSAMIISVFGLSAARRVERRWTLMAEEAHGPEIPSLAVPILLKKLSDSEVAPGARDAGELLSLDDFEESFARLAVRHQTSEVEQPLALYERLMGPRFAALPPAVRSTHTVLRDAGASGLANVLRGKSLITRFTGAWLGFPTEGEHELHVHFREQDGRETWKRSFSGRGFQSELSARGGLLVERFGLLRFGFDLPSDETGLQMFLRRWWLGPLPLPLFLSPQSEAREWEEGGRFHFDVSISLPIGGLLAHYRGWLKPPNSAPFNPC